MGGGWRSRYLHASERSNARRWIWIRLRLRKRHCEDLGFRCGFQLGRLGNSNKQQLELETTETERCKDRIMEGREGRKERGKGKQNGSKSVCSRL